MALFFQGFDCTWFLPICVVLCLFLARVCIHIQNRLSVGRTCSKLGGLLKGILCEVYVRDCRLCVKTMASSRMTGEDKTGSTSSSYNLQETSWRGGGIRDGIGPHTFFLFPLLIFPTDYY